MDNQAQPTSQAVTQTATQTVNPNPGKNKVFIYLLVVFFAVFIGTGIFVGLGAKKNQPAPKEQTATTSNPTNETSTLKQENMVIPTVAPTAGSFELGVLPITGGVDPGFSVGKNIDIALLANSEDKNIVGYDTVVFYDPLSFDFQEAKSSVPDFKIYSYNRGNYLLLTAVKSLGSSTPTVFGPGSSKQAIASISFKPKKAGKFNFSLRQSAGNDITDMVTDQTEVLSPAMKDLTVEVK